MSGIVRNPRCPVCSATSESLDYRIDGVPVRSMTIHDDRAHAMDVDRGAIDLAACHACGLVFNAAFDPTTQSDDSDYEETQGFSPTFRGYSADLARRLIARYGLDDGLVLEIGCGKAGFLATLCSLCGIRGVGVDPTVDAARVPEDLRDRLLVIRDRYRDAHGRWAAEADLVCCRHTLEHLYDPLEILAPLRRHLADRPRVPVFIDVPSGGHVLEVGGCWDVYYEHCMYYRDEAFAGMLERSGFVVRDLRREYDGQYLCVEATIGEASGPRNPVTPPDTTPLRRMRTAWGEWFASDARRNVVLWGSGSRAVGFLGAVDVDGGVGGVVDINPHRHGRWMPGFDRPILAPDELPGVGPDAIVVMNPAYVSEIRAMLDELGVDVPLLRVDQPPA